jgi:hypothetical protein
MKYLLNAVGLTPSGSSAVHIYTQVHIYTPNIQSIDNNIVTAQALALTRMVLHSQTKKVHACTSETDAEWGDTLKQEIMLHSYASDGTVSNTGLFSVSARHNYVSTEMGESHNTV